jgi:N-acetylglucosaminyldiphosphoundecaprenol N-acetyl-beta-D-mannosaminyltransferase
MRETDSIPIDRAEGLAARHRPASVDVLGVPICPATFANALEAVDEAIRARKPLHIGVVNAAKVVNMRRDSRLRAAVLKSDLIFADGMAVVWASRMLGTPLPERVAGIDLMMGILARGHERGYSVYCLGATEAVSARCAEIIQRDFPGVRLVGRHHGYYGSEGEAGVVEDIARAKPDVLFVAMTSPKKEEFLARWSGSLNTTVTHGVGGSFDVLAGKVARAPERWQRLGLEWLYRAKQEPRRLGKRYLVTNAAFCWLVLRGLLRNLT